MPFVSHTCHITTTCHAAGCVSAREEWVRCEQLVDSGWGMQDSARVGPPYFL